MNLKGVFAKNERGYRLNAIKKFSKRGEPPPPRPLQNIILPPPLAKVLVAPLLEPTYRVKTCVWKNVPGEHKQL